MISIKNLTKEFSGQKVLDGINFDIEKGEVVALVGASVQVSQPSFVA